VFAPIQIDIATKKELINETPCFLNNVISAPLLVSSVAKHTQHFQPSIWSGSTER